MAEGNVKVRRALLSVTDKTGLAEFARALSEEFDVEIISTGGTARALRDAGVKVREISDVTGFPEIMGGRVKTLHPKVHGGILKIRGNATHEAEAQEHGIENIDLVVINLYAFEQTVAKPGVTLDDAVENIDIGGPAMIRSAAKNHKDVTVVTKPEQYPEVLNEMRKDNKAGMLSFATRFRFARDAYKLTASYDAAIGQYFDGLLRDKFPDVLVRAFRKAPGDIRYAENPHQQGALYLGPKGIEATVAHAKLLPGGTKSVSYNNYVDTNAAWELVTEFTGPAVAIIKHTNPAGCATGSEGTSMVGLYCKAYMADPNAAMGGIIAVNRPILPPLAQAIIETFKNWGKAAGAGGFFAEVIIAPNFDEDSVAIIRDRAGWGTEVRLLETGPISGVRNAELQLKSIPAGLLAQERDLLGLNEEQWRVVTKIAPTQEQMDDLRFAWLCVKHVKSNAIVLAHDLTLLAAGAGQMSRVTSTRLSRDLSLASPLTRGKLPPSTAFGSDAFLPFSDSVYALPPEVVAIIQPGGSKKDNEVIAAANERGIAMIFTGTRHFRH